MKERNTNFKVELHCHLDGSLPLKTIRELLVLHGKWERRFEDMTVLKEQVTVPKNCTSLQQYLRCFDLPLSLMQTPEDMEIASYGLASEFVNTGVRYAEVRFAPQLHSRNIEHNKKYKHERNCLLAVLKGIQRATNRTNTVVKVILCLMRNLPEGADGQIANARTLVLMNEFAKNTDVVGLDLAGAEARDATAKFESYFQYAANQGHNFTIHAGEAGDMQWRMDSIERAIYFGAKRIGHGVALEHSKSLRYLVRDKGIVVECCPTSNIQTKAVSSIDVHPIKMMLDEGIKVTVNTDNMTVSDTTLEKEYDLIRRIGITDEEIIAMQKNAIKGAFCSDKEKKKMLKNFK